MRRGVAGGQRMEQALEQDGVRVPLVVRRPVAVQGDLEEDSESERLSDNFIYLLLSTREIMKQDNMVIALTGFASFQIIIFYKEGGKPVFTVARLYVSRACAQTY